MKTGGPKLTKDATIVVTEKPHFKKHMAVSTLGEFGKAITLPCDVHAGKGLSHFLAVGGARAAVETII